MRECRRVGTATPTLCSPDTSRAHLTRSTSLGLFPPFIHLLSIFYSAVKGKHEYPTIVFQFESNFTEKLTTFTDKTGINNSISIEKDPYNERRVMIREDFLEEII